MQPGYGPPASGERWNVNMPAVIGVVFVFLIGVVVWVLAASPGSDESDVAPPTSTTATSTEATPAPTLSPTPLPTTSSTATTSSTTPAAPATTASIATSAPSPTAPSPTSTVAPPPTSSGAVTGDLDVPGRPMQDPPCDGAYITIVGSPIGEQATAVAVGAVLEQYPGTNYLRTDQSCRSLAQDVDGEPIYVIYFGPFAVASDACEARADGPDDAYARALSDELGPDHAVACT